MLGTSRKSISIKVICNYLKDPDTNVFLNSWDALGGILVLLVLPFVSIGTIIAANASGFVAYCFPIMSICAAGCYDSYSKYEKNHPKKYFLYFRVVIDIVSLILSALFCYNPSAPVRIIAPLLLAVPGILLFYEAMLRIRTALELSQWNHD